MMTKWSSYKHGLWAFCLLEACAGVGLFGRIARGEPNPLACEGVGLKGLVLPGNNIINNN